MIKIDITITLDFFKEFDVFFHKFTSIEYVSICFRNFMIIHSFIETARLKSTGPVYRLFQNLQPMKLTGLTSKEPVCRSVITYSMKCNKKPMGHIAHLSNNRHYKICLMES